MRLPSLSLVIGGTASGKSAFAEGLVHQSGLAKVYLATAEALDAEMQIKIDSHREARAGQGWRTVEAPRDPAPPLAQLEAEEVALFDCATLWLTNVMLDGRDWEDEADQLIEVMTLTVAPVVVVTNEVGQSIVPDTKLGRQFQRAQGVLNQRLAAEADLVVLVTAGLPTVLKNTLPQGGTPW